MNVFQKIIAAPMAAKHLADALDASAHEDYQGALTHLDHADKSYKGKRIKYHLFRGFVCFALKKDSEAVENFEASIELLKNNDRCNEDERNYILGYATIFGNKALDAGKNIKGSKSFPEIDISSINLSNVRSSFKRWFPLRYHPNWDEKIK